MKFQFRVIILTCLWLTFLLRVWGLDFGLPYEFHPDEHQYVDAALDWHTTGEMEARFVNPPLFTYILILVFKYWFIFSPFEASPDWLANIYMFARLWSVIFGILTVALMYPLGKLLYHQKAGLLGVILMTGLFLPARESHFAVNDTMVTFFTLLTVYFCLKIFNRPRKIYYVAAGFAIGLATAAKLTGALIISALLVTHILVFTNQPRSYRQRIFKPKEHVSLWIALLVAFITFVFGAFHVVFQLPQFIIQMGELVELSTQSVHGVKLAPATGWQFYIGVLGWGVGWTMLLAILIALGYTFFKRSPEGLILSIFPVLLFIFMGGQKLVTARYLLPAIPPLVALVGAGLVELEERWLLFQRYRLVFWPFILIFLLAQPATYLIWFDHLLTLPNTQQLATDWFLENFPEDTVVAKETYSILPDVVFIDGRWPYKTITLDKGSQTEDENHYISSKTQIIVTSNFRSARIRVDPAAEEIRLAQIAVLNEKATLIKEFNPYRRPDYDDWFYLDQLYGPAGETLQRVSPGPHIKIYRLPYENQPHSQEMPAVSVPVNANFGDKLILLGYDLPVRRAEPGESLLLTLYWQAASRMDETYVVFNHLLDNEQRNWGGYDRWPQETANTMLWHSGEIVVDTFNLPVSVDAPDGVYTIDIGLYNRDDPAAIPLPILRDGIPIEENSVRIGLIKVGGAPPDIVLLSSKINPAVSLSVELGEPPVILLRGYDLTQSDNTLKLNLYWESLASTSVDWSVFAHIRNDTGEVVAQKDGPAGNGRYPSSLWDTSEIIVDEIIIPIADLSDADYDLYIGLYDLSTGARLQIEENLANEILLLEDLALK